MNYTYFSFCHVFLYISIGSTPHPVTVTTIITFLVGYPELVGNPELDPTSYHSLSYHPFFVAKTAQGVHGTRVRKNHQLSRSPSSKTDPIDHSRTLSDQDLSHRIHGAGQ